VIHRGPPTARRDRGCVPSGGSRVPSTRASCHAGQRPFTTFGAWYCLSPDHHLSISGRRSRRRCPAVFDVGEKQNAPPGTWRRWGVVSLPVREGDRMLEPASSLHDACA
jgi:hypothetical protein